MAKQDDGGKPQSYWLNVFHNSKVNGAEYREDHLPSQTWTWPTDPYLQRRLKEVRANSIDEPVIVAQNSTLREAGQNQPDGRARAGAAKQPVDNAKRKEKGLVVEWDDIDDRLTWFARPNNN